MLLLATAAGPTAGRGGESGRAEARRAGPLSGSARRQQRSLATPATGTVALIATRTTNRHLGGREAP
eukprot:5257874-Alexandrium_andersonii.AAC.1